MTRLRRILRAVRNWFARLIGDQRNDDGLMPK